MSAVRRLTAYRCAAATVCSTGGTDPVRALRSSSPRDGSARPHRAPCSAACRLSQCPCRSPRARSCLSPPLRHAYPAGSVGRGMRCAYSDTTQRACACGYRYSCTKAFIMAFCMTFFSVFDVPVFWPILLIYWIMLFFITMKRQIRHMIKHRYLPFSFGKQVRIPHAQHPCRLPTHARTYRYTVVHHYKCTRVHHFRYEHVDESTPIAPR